MQTKNLPWEGYGYFLEPHIAVSGLMLRLKAKELANDPRPPSDGIKTGSGTIPLNKANSGSTPAR